MNNSVSLQTIVTSILASPEIKAKQAIRSIAPLFEQTDSEQKYALPGDDCAAFLHGDGFDLLASEGMQPDFLVSAPWRAGWSAVMANVSDIAAMGGQPTGIVSTLWHCDAHLAKDICEGIKHACDVFQISYSGGHLNIAPSNTPNLSVAIHGKAKHLLSCWHVKPGMSVYALTNLNGQWQNNQLYWNCLSKRAHHDLRKDWQLPHHIANHHMAMAAKDISNAGLLGTLLMMLELNACGADIDLNAVKYPSGVQLLDWLRAFQSFGFIFCCAPEQEKKLEGFFETSHLTLQRIGTVRKDTMVKLHCQGDSETLWQFDREALTGLATKEKNND